MILHLLGKITVAQKCLETGDQGNVYKLPAGLSTATLLLLVELALCILSVLPNVTETRVDAAIVDLGLEP
jgi:hypothetical protein